MEYRIKQCGETKFIPQCRYWKFWSNYPEYHDPSGFWGTLSFSTLAKAKEFLDEQVKYDEHQKSLKQVKYHKYP